MVDQVPKPWQTFAYAAGGGFFGSLAAILLLWWLCGCPCVDTAAVDTAAQALQVK